MRTAPTGQHNAVLCRATYALGQLVGAGFLDSDTARAELTTASSVLIAADCDCTPAEVARLTLGLFACAFAEMTLRRDRNGVPAQPDEPAPRLGVVTPLAMRALGPGGGLPSHSGAPVP